MTVEEFFSVADAVVQANGREPLSSRHEVRRAIEVQETDQVLQILAGPGSGKTEVLVWRILFELFVAGTDASRIVVTTFTNKAANELQVRITDRSDAFLAEVRERGLVVSDPRVHNLRAGTLHSLCDQLLSEFDPAYRTAGLTMIDEHEHRARLSYTGDFVGGRATGCLSRLLAIPELAGLFRPPWKKGAWPANRFDRLTMLLKVYTHTVETYIPRCSNGQRRHGLSERNQQLDGDLIELHRRWAEHLESKHVVDFAGIQLRLLSAQRALDGKLSHMFVDEFQDNNPIQFALHLGWLSDPHTKVTVVGDDDQAIYRFRGSDAACFQQLERECQARDRFFRLERLATNHRSTKCIVAFSQAFRRESAIARVSMEKTVIAPDDAKQGAPVRVLRGNMRELATICAAELAAFGYGGDAPPVESAAILSWSTSEDGTRPVAVLRSALEPDIRVYNPRAKTAAKRGSALSDLLGILSYMVDPITVEPVGANGRRVEVWAQHNRHSASAATIPPPFPENDDHTDFQKWFRKPEPRSPISPTTPEKQDILDYIDHIKLELATRGRQYTRLTLSGLIARVLSFPFFANSGFTVQLLRQALFTQLYEAYVLPTRQTMSPLDSTLEVELQNGKWVWPDRYWRFMGVFASVLKNISVDDPESEAFEEGAVPVITFHQAKGLEFDHVYVIGGGRQVETRSALTNMLFSGVAVPISMKEALTDSTDPQVLIQAQADADREFYVAISRPKRSLTVLSANDEKDIPDYAREHPAVTRVVSAGNYPIRQQGAVMVIEIAYA